MRVDFRPADTGGGDTAYYLRFEDDRGSDAILVDYPPGGPDAPRGGLDADLRAVVLTHAHTDHVGGLEAAPPDAPLLAAPPTAALLDEAWPVSLAPSADPAAASPRAPPGAGGGGDESPDTAAPPVGGGGPPAVGDLPAGRVAPLPPAWTPVRPGVAVRPVPAGHAPGASGILVRFETGGGGGAGSRRRGGRVATPGGGSGGDHEYLLCTGDFTTHPVGGTPGLGAGIGVDVGAVFCNATTREGSCLRSVVGETVTRAVAAARRPGPVAVLADGTAAVHYARLFEGLDAHADGGLGLSVAVAGRPAKLHRRLAATCGCAGGGRPPGERVVTAVEEFDDVAPLLDAHDVIVGAPAAPATADDGPTVAGRVVEEMAARGGGTVVRASNHHITPLEGPMDTFDRQYEAHPDWATIDALVAALSPRVVVPFHGNTGAFGDRYEGVIEWTRPPADWWPLWVGGSWGRPPGYDDADARVAALLADADTGAGAGAGADAGGAPTPDGGTPPTDRPAVDPLGRDGFVGPVAPAAEADFPEGSFLAVVAGVPTAGRAGDRGEGVGR